MVKQSIASLNSSNTLAPATKQEQGPDEDTGVMVYGHLKITDLDTGEILVNKRA